MAPHGLILWENAATGLKIIFKDLRGHIIPQTVLALRGSDGVGLVPWISHIWSRGGCRGAAGELPGNLPQVFRLCPKSFDFDPSL